MRWMRRAEQRVDNKSVHTFQCGKGCFWNDLGVGHVAKRADAIRKDRRTAVWDVDGREREIAHMNRFTRLHGKSARLGFVRAGQRLHVLIQDVRHALRDIGERLGRAVHRERHSAANGEGAHVIDAVNVVGVGVGKHHRIDTANTGGHELQPQFGRRVDQYTRSGSGFDDGAGTGAFVARIGGVTHPAPAADLRNTETGSRA